MFGRRGFLSMLGMAAAAPFLPALPSLPKSIIYEPELIKAAVPLGLDPVGLEAITKAMGIEFEREYSRLMKGTYKTTVWTGAFAPRIGDRGITTQYHVGVGLIPGENQQVMERFIRPAAEVLAKKAVHDGINVFSTLALPAGSESCVYSSSLSSIRGVWQWSMENDRHLMRFDILGGRSDA
jgi:hypothetical protein